MNVVSDQIHLFLKNCLKNSYKIKPIAGDASLRNYYRVIDKTSSYILMVTDSFDSSKDPFLNVLSYLKLNHILAPSLIQFEGSLGVILLEDLGDESLQKVYLNNKEPFALNFYKKALDHLVQLQFCSKKGQDSCVAFSRCFDEALFLKECEFAFSYLNDLYLLKFDITLLSSFFKKISYELAQRPQLFSHRDYHSRNLMVFKNNIYLLDFQDAIKAPLFYDVVSLVCDAYVPLNETVQKDLLSYYLEKAHSFYPDIHKEYERSYALQCFQRTFKACGSFASFVSLIKNKEYLKYLPKNIKLLRSLVESDFKDENELRKFLEQLSKKVIGV